MKRIFVPLIVLLSIACREAPKEILTAQGIVDRSIEASGGDLYTQHGISFIFRDKEYISKNEGGTRVFKRISRSDSVTMTDVKKGNDFERYRNDSLIAIPDTMAVKYANSINSVHYFVRLPFGLNDGAVIKELLGKESIDGKEYYKVKVTFAQQGGGDDYEDTYLYWFDTDYFKPDYLAYEFHVEGGGQRFRKAYNERYINGIRFVDYENYKPKTGNSGFLEIGQLFDKGELELLSKIEITDIEVQKD